MRIQEEQQQEVGETICTSKKHKTGQSHGYRSESWFFVIFQKKSQNQKWVNSIFFGKSGMWEHHATEPCAQPIPGNPTLARFLHHIPTRAVHNNMICIGW